MLRELWKGDRIFKSKGRCSVGGAGAGTLLGKLQWGPLVMWASLVPPLYKILNPIGSHRGQIMPLGMSRKGLSAALNCHPSF